jgi:hypothetical protein
MAAVYVHRSQFPDIVQAQYWQSFADRQIDHKFHYMSYRQSQKWLALHHAYSPAIRDPGFQDAHGQAFAAAAEIAGPARCIVALGCGGGEKDADLLGRLPTATLTGARYYPVDVSLTLVLIAAAKAQAVCPRIACRPIVCDLRHAPDLSEAVREDGEGMILTFLGMIPNFHPEDIVPKLAMLLQSGDLLLASANLAPGPDYIAGVQAVFAQYDNPLTQDWLQTTLLDAGVDLAAGQLSFVVVGGSAEGASRITAVFKPFADIRLSIGGQPILWPAQQPVELFFSYRYTTDMMKNLFTKHGIEILHAFESSTQEEGVYLCRKL